MRGHMHIAASNRHGKVLDLEAVAGYYSSRLSCTKSYFVPQPLIGSKYVCNHMLEVALVPNYMFSYRARCEC